MKVDLSWLYPSYNYQRAGAVGWASGRFAAEGAATFLPAISHLPMTPSPSLQHLYARRHATRLLLVVHGFFAAGGIRISGIFFS
jgi:hypothetical protein